ncbi:unnamed protein product [Haemonchus placei]|uniref:DUF4347 domain-containing protein n=1 Tax=Haemonchus placei TaxID=6290 RepID=A0A0N4X9W4_HAEPC|nr:unnamed protein product [Haemonchus placei]
MSNWFINGAWIYVSPRRGPPDREFVWLGFYSASELLKSPFTLIIAKDLDLSSLQDAIGNGFVIFADERLKVSLSEVATLMEYARRNPLRLIGVHGVEFDWQKGRIDVGRVYNALFFSLVIFHSQYLSENISPIPLVLWNECFPAVLNVVITERSMLPPMVIGERGPEFWMKLDADTACLRKVPGSELVLLISNTALRFVMIVSSGMGKLDQTSHRFHWNNLNPSDCVLTTGAGIGVSLRAIYGWPMAH